MSPKMANRPMKPRVTMVYSRKHKRMKIQTPSLALSHKCGSVIRHITTILLCRKNKDIEGNGLRI